MTPDPDWPEWAAEWFEERLAIMQADDVPRAEQLARIRTEMEISRRVREDKARQQ